MGFFDKINYSMIDITLNKCSLSNILLIVP